MVTVIKKYAPIVAAAAYLVYVAASGQTVQIPTALTALLAAFGYHSATSAHSKIDLI